MGSKKGKKMSTGLTPMMNRSPIGDQTSPGESDKENIDPNLRRSARKVASSAKSSLFDQQKTARETRSKSCSRASASPQKNPPRKRAASARGGRQPEQETSPSKKSISSPPRKRTAYANGDREPEEETATPPPPTTHRARKLVLHLGTPSPARPAKPGVSRNFSSRAGWMRGATPDEDSDEEEEKSPITVPTPRAERRVTRAVSVGRGTAGGGGKRQGEQSPSELLAEALSLLALHSPVKRGGRAGDREKSPAPRTIATRATPARTATVTDGEEESPITAPTPRAERRVARAFRVASVDRGTEGGGGGRQEEQSPSLALHTPVTRGGGGTGDRGREESPARNAEVFDPWLQLPLKQRLMMRLEEKRAAAAAREARVLREKTPTRAPPKRGNREKSSTRTTAIRATPARTATTVSRNDELSSTTRQLRDRTPTGATAVSREARVLRDRTPTRATTVQQQSTTPSRPTNQTPARRRATVKTQKKKLDLAKADDEEEKSSEESEYDYDEDESEEEEEGEEKQQKRRKHGGRGAAAARAQFKVQPVRDDEDENEPMEASEAPSSLAAALDRLAVYRCPRGTLLCREAECAQIKEFIRAAIAPNGISQACYISGVPGTGKTASVMAMVKELRATTGCPPFIFLRVNAMYYPDPKQVFSELLYEYERRTSGEENVRRLSGAEARKRLNALFGSVDEMRPPVILLVDELDQLNTPTQELIYDVFNWSAVEAARVSIISVANTLDLPERMLEPRMISRLGMNRIVFQPYTHAEIERIVLAKLGGASDRPEDAIIDPQVVEIAARKVAAISGDLRKATDILQEAIKAAIRKGETRLTFEQVNEATRAASETLLVLAVRSLAGHEEILFESAVDIVRTRDVSDFSMAEYVEKYESMSMLVHGESPINYDGVLRATSRLTGLGLLRYTNPSQRYMFQRRIQLVPAVHDAVSALKIVALRRAEQATVA